MAAKAKAESKAGREIGELPDVQDPVRKESCRKNLRLFYETYFPHTFRTAWSEDHLRLIKKLQSAILAALDQAFAMPRGTGKSAMCERAVIWSALYGHRFYSMLLCANGPLAQKSLIKLQTELEQNELLAADFPEVCYPIACLQRIAQRARGQCYRGEPTFLQWAGDQIILPVIPGSPASGAVICVAGLGEAVRGSSFYHLPTKGIVRPNLVIVDDPQTRESARSEIECGIRLQIITEDVPGMAGPGEPFSLLVPCTIIEPGDVAATLLDREKHPEFRGERCQLLYSLPENMELWSEYDAIRRRSFKDAPDAIDSAEELWRECNEFYAAHREEMDKGAIAAWPERKLPHELSAIQHGMNILLKNPGLFWTEYQNDPASAIDHDEELLTDVEIARKFSGFERWRVPEGCQYVTAFIDCHKRVLYYAVAAWTPHFDGFIIDYGTYPKQKHGYFTERTAKPTLDELYPKLGLEGALYAGVEALTMQLFAHKLIRDDGAKMPLNLVLIDSGWKRDVIFRYCAASPYESRVAPSLGRRIGPDQTPLSSCKPKKGEHIGLEWTIPAAAGREVRQVQFDKYFWFSFLQRRLSTANADRGCLSIFGKQVNGRPTEDHDFFGQHLASWYPTVMTARRTCDVWKQRPGQSQDHWLDCCAGVTVAASVVGAAIVGAPELLQRKQSARKVTFPDVDAA